MKEDVFFKKSCKYFTDESKLHKLVEKMKNMLLFLLLILSFTSCSGSKEGEIILGTFTIESGDYDRFDTPVRYECKLSDIFGDNTALLSLSDHQFKLYEFGRGRSELLAQWEPKIGFNWEKTDDQGSLIWILEGRTKSVTKRRFRLVLKEDSSSPSPFSVQKIDNKSLLIKSDNRPVLQYNYGIIPENEGQTGIYDRSSYIHPVWTPAGNVITGDFSPEHIWQRGIFLAWQKAKFGEIETNFWELGKSTGRTLKDEIDPVVMEGPAFSEIAIYNKGTVEGKTFFKELCLITLYNLTGKDKYIFDIIFRQFPVDPDNPDTIPLELKTMELQKVYYGGMSFRGVSPGWLYYDYIASNKGQPEKFNAGAKWLNPGDSLYILTSEGLSRKNGNGIPARWIDYTGPLGESWGGIVMFDRPSNQRYPTPLRIHPDMPYFCFAFTKEDSYMITSETPLTLKYRIVIHEGKPDKILNEQLAHDFTDPPKVNWERKR